MNQPPAVLPSVQAQPGDTPAPHQRQLLILQPDRTIAASTAFDSIDQFLARPDALLWLDMQSPDDSDIALLREEFAYHPLVEEHVRTPMQRPKIVQYDDTWFIMFYAVEQAGDDVRLLPLRMYIGPKFVVTIHDVPIPDLTQALERWRRTTQFDVPLNPAMILYAILDTIVDNYFPILDDVAERVEDIEESIFTARGEEDLKAIFQIKKELLEFRRYAAPCRDVLNALMRREAPVFGNDYVLFFQDVYDHIQRVVETIDTYRDLLISAVDIHLSNVSNRLNTVMKKMTAISTILMSCGLLTGIYGMNFAFIPAAGWQFGFLATVAVMLVLGVVLFWFFRQIDWL